ncbi:MAG: SDR family oxidoreductase [Deltaproteobacteria bacterium]|nr:SDR family oxidoreductase [Deltaproteobacteria bacterium]
MSQKTAIITGGNRGIGRSITEAFVDAGYAVVVGARTDTGIGTLFPDKVRYVSVDVRQESGHRQLTETAVTWTGQVDVYVNNAGFSEWRPIELIDEAFFDDLIGTNLKGAFWGCKAAVDAMRKGGAIINISSIAGKRGSSNNALYCASKFGMNGLTQALAKEVGQRSIRVNAVCPVLVPTQGLLQALDGPYAPAKGNIDAFLAKFTTDNAALGRLPTAAEVAALCVFLASDEASAITAQCINVDCGVLPQ